MYTIDLPGLTLPFTGPLHAAIDAAIRTWIDHLVATGIPTAITLRDSDRILGCVRRGVFYGA